MQNKETYLNYHWHAHPSIHHLLILMAEFFRYPQRKCTQAVGALTEHVQTFILLFQLLLWLVGIIIEKMKRKIRTNLLRRHARTRQLHYHIRCKGSQFMVPQYCVVLIHSSLTVSGTNRHKIWSRISFLRRCFRNVTFRSLIHRGQYRQPLPLGQILENPTKQTCPTTWLTLWFRICSDTKSFSSSLSSE